MNTLIEVEKAANALTPAERQQLFLALARGLRAEGQLPPPPRKLTLEEMTRWMDEDEAGFKRFKEMA